MSQSKQLIGFVGQGWIGKNYANDFEKRGFQTVRYSLEKPYLEKIKDCDIVFIAVPTPTTLEGFDGHIVEEALTLVGRGKIAVIKSTVLPGTTTQFQEKYSILTIIYSPEFLSEATAEYDSAYPFSNIIGLSLDTPRHRTASDKLISVLPHAPFQLVCTSTEAEMIKYTHNVSGYVQIMFFNMMYDFTRTIGCDWSVIRQALIADPFVASQYSEPIHKSGRGAGGGCFIKDFASFKKLYTEKIPDDIHSHKILTALEDKNIELLTKSGKDLGLVKGVYGEISINKDCPC